MIKFALRYIVFARRYRELCGIGRASSFSGLSRLMPQSTIQKLSGIYNNVDDIDLFVGMLSEFTQSDSMLGATALCIIGNMIIHSFTSI